MNAAPATPCHEPLEVLLDRANKAGAAGRDAEAEALWREYLQIDPDNMDVNFNVGVCVGRRARTADDMVDAATFYERVIVQDMAGFSADMRAALMERKADAMNNLGLIAEKVGRTDKALECFGFALKMWPEHRPARINFGDSKRMLGDWEGASREYDAVLDNDPQSPEAHFCAGMIALLLGDFERGWREYRWRFRTPSFKSAPYVSDKPQWTGEALDGKTLMFTEEQGFGDSIQFIRYAAKVKTLWPHSRVMFRCQPCLHGIMRGVNGLDAVVDVTGDIPRFDYHSPLLDAPHYCGMKTEDDIPAAPYITPQPDWLPWSFASTGRKRVGLVWAGSPTHGKDLARSIKATAFQPLIDAHPECDFYSLQAGPRQPEVATLNRVTDLAEEIGNWTETAQMLMGMDVLVSVDTACAHLAGAVGTPAFILIPFSPDFRWQLKREDSPWYPKARLFRQPDGNDWQTPLRRISEAL